MPAFIELLVHFHYSKDFHIKVTGVIVVAFMGLVLLREFCYPPIKFHVPRGAQRSLFSRVRLTDLCERSLGSL